MQAFAKWGLFAGIFACGLGATHYEIKVRSRPLAAPVVAKAERASPPTDNTGAPTPIVDPLDSEHPVTIDNSVRPGAEDWVHARPGFQSSRKIADRGGVDPCAPPSVDSSAYDAWSELGQGHFMAPREHAVDDAGHFNLVIHLNGDEPARRELVQSGQHFVLYSLTLEQGQSYAPLFTGTALFDAIVAGVEQGLSKRAGRAAHVEHVALSAWSAGFVGIEAALAQPFARDIDGVVLSDALHAPRNDDAAFRAQLAPFVDFAKRSAAGEKFMFVAHSSIDPPDFASTTETAHYLIAAVGGKPSSVRRDDPLGLELVEYFSRGNFHVRGYAGNDKADHCALVATLRSAYAALGRRWSPHALVTAAAADAER